MGRQKSTALTLKAMLAESPWFQTLDLAERAQVLQDSYERHLLPGAYAMRCGEPADCWIGVIEGLVKMSVSQPDGRHATLTGVTHGGWAGEGSLLKPGPWRYDGVALRTTRLACVPRYLFEQLVATNLAFNHFLLAHLNARLSLFVGQVEYDRLLRADARVARCLASLFHPTLYPQATPFVQLSQEEIGLLSAMSRQRANEALHQLERAGLLRVEFRGVTVLDLPGLRDYAGSDDVRLATRPGELTAS